MVLITENRFCISELSLPFEADPNFRVIIDEGRLTIEKLPEHEFVEFELHPEISAYYDDEEGEVFKDKLREPAFYLIQFTDIEVLKLILLRTVDRPHMYLDNDLGLVISSIQFLELVKNRPGWDWAWD